MMKVTLRHLLQTLPPVEGEEDLSPRGMILSLQERGWKGCEDRGAYVPIEKFVGENLRIAEEEFEAMFPFLGGYLLYRGSRDEYLVLPQEKFRRKFGLGYLNRTLEEAFEAFLSSGPRFESWTPEERASWLQKAVLQGFRLEEAERLYFKALRDYLSRDEEVEWWKLRQSWEEWLRQFPADLLPIEFLRSLPPGWS